MSGFLDGLSRRLWLWHLRRMMRVECGQHWLVEGLLLDIHDEWKREFYEDNLPTRVEALRELFDKAMKRAAP